MSWFINDGGTARRADRIAVNDSGTIRNVARAYFNDGGTVREIFDYGIPPVQTLNFNGTRSNVVIPESGNNEVYQLTLDSNFNSGSEIVTEAAPTVDGTTTDFGVTGLSVTRLTTNTDSGFTQRRTLTGSGGPVSFRVTEGNGSTRITDIQIRTTGNAQACLSAGQQTNCNPTAGTKSLNDYRAIGSYRYRSNSGTVSEWVRVRTTTVSYTTCLLYTSPSPRD